MDVKNTAIKFALDQSVGAAFNIFLFVAGVGMLKGLGYKEIVEALKKVGNPLSILFYFPISTGFW